MHELRWTLLILGVLFIAALALWERRRPRQASEQSPEHRGTRAEPGGEAPARVFREPTLTLPEIRVREPPQPQELPVVEITEALRAERDAPSLPVLEPDMSASRDHMGDARRSSEALSDEDQFNEDVFGETFAAESTPGEPKFGEAQSGGTTSGEGPADDMADSMRAVPAEALPELAPADEPASDGAEDPYTSSVPAEPIVEWPADDQRKIIALRLVAPAPERFPGRAVRQALAAEGFVLGKFSIFHKADEDRRAYLSAASLTKPGTFDLETMDTQRYGGLSLFAVLPGPKTPSQAFDELLSSARNLNERLQGALQDEKGGPLTPTRIASLRESLAAGAPS